jgi:streptogramin lyase
MGVADGPERAYIDRSTDRGVSMQREWLFLRSAACLLAALVLSAAHAPAQSRTYTLDGDFDEGTLVNVNHDDHSGQLQVNREVSALPFIWIAQSRKGTVVRIDVVSGEVLGEYRSAPEGHERNPSRTTVDHFGSVWVSNRLEADGDRGSVIKIGVLVGGERGSLDANGDFVPDASGDYVRDPAYTQCVDRDGDGLIRTSGGRGDVLAWPAGSDGVGSPCDPGDPDARVEDAADECILIFQRVRPVYARHLSVNAGNDVWVGSRDNGLFDLLEGETGCPVDGFSSPGCGGYGGVMDCSGIVWSASPAKEVMRYDPATRQVTCFRTGNPYGMGIDSEGYIWNSQYHPGLVLQLDPADGAILRSCPVDPNGYCQVYTWYYNDCRPGETCPSGMAVRTRDDTIWTANRHCNYLGLGHDAVSRLDRDCNLLKMIPLYDPATNLGGNSITGVAVDAHGKVWVTASGSDNVFRIDPGGGADGLGEVDLAIDLGPATGPYNYSDMTGSVLLSHPPFGLWSVVAASDCEPHRWTMLGWNSESPLPAGALHEPEGTTIRVEARSADTRASLAAATFLPVSNGTPVAGLAGRFLELRARLRVDGGGACGPYLTPVLTDLTVHGESELSIDCPPDATLECPARTGPDATGWATAVCGAVGHADSVVPGCSPTETITRTWTATSEFGNESCDQIVRVVDTTPPLFDPATLPADETVECDAVPPPARPAASDACDPDVEIAFAETRTDGPCVDSYTLTRTWTAVDDCGNSVAHTQTVTVRDTTAPELRGVPPDVTVECDEVPPPASPTATDNCDPAPSVSFVETRVDGNCPGEYVLTRTWTAVDRCGNSAAATQVVTVVDTTPPEIGEGGEDLYCVWPPNHRYVCFDPSDFAPAIVDNCSEPITWSFAGCASDQPDEARDPDDPGWNGDGHTTDDCVVDPDGHWICVRAERAGTGPGDRGLPGPSAQEGRRYGVAIVASDGCENVSAPAVLGHIHVPHDQSPHERPCVNPTKRGCGSKTPLPCF